jgi:feruloyl esterase
VEALSAFNVANVTIKAATVVPAKPPKQQYCDVRGNVATNGDGAGANVSGFQVMLPAQWNGKFVYRGTRGTGGNLASAANQPDLDQFLVKGYASVTSDSGHTREPDWYYDKKPGVPNIPKLADAYYRSMHQVTGATKQVVTKFYGAQSIRYAYFDGCSNGGRQAVMEAARYPDDFDGIVAGSIWFDPLGSELNDLKNARAFLDPAAHIPLARMKEVDAAVMTQCDALDGVKDGLIQNPGKCGFDPHTLVPSVLTKPQADAIDSLLSGIKDEHGDLVTPGSSVSRLYAQSFGVRRSQDGTMTPGFQLETPAPRPTDAHPWGDDGDRTPHSWSAAEGVILTLGYNDESLDMNNTIFSAPNVVKTGPLEFLYRRLGADIVGDPAGLKPFLAKGKKMVMFHGLNDVPVSGNTTILFYEDLAEQNGGYEKLQNQARLFMVPGANHCTDGPEPVFFDTLTALEKWVEEGVAPASLQATYTSDWGKTTVRTMPLCKFPEMARYNGSGDVNDAKNWTCPAGDQRMLEIGRNGTQAGLGDRQRHGKYVNGTPAPAITP